MTEGPGEPTVLAERQGAVLLLTFNRPDRMNGWMPEMERSYFRLLDEADSDPAVRAIVVTGAGRAFCAGADLDRLTSLSRGETAAPPPDPPKTFPLRIRKPVIAAVNGACAGIGLLIALCADVRFVSEQAKLTTAFARRGLVAEGGISWLLPRIVGTANALDLLVSGRVVTGVEAERIGLANRALAPERVLPEALAYAHDLAAQCSPASMAVIKRQVYRHLDTTLEEALADSHHLLGESFLRPDAREGVDSFVARRAPHFPPLALAASPAGGDRHGEQV